MPATQLFFEAAILDQPLPQSSTQSAALYRKLCEEKSVSRNQGDIAWRLWQVIVRDPAEPPALEAVAQELHCSPRTLSRKLLAQGWRYQQLIDQVREIHARRYLSDPTLHITQVAQRLGYADSSGFHRAFKKWTGHSPQSLSSRVVHALISGEIGQGYVLIGDVIHSAQIYHNHSGNKSRCRGNTDEKI